MTKVTTMGKQLQLGHLNLNLKLNGRAILNIEKRLGKSIMSLFMNSNGSMKLPPSNEILIVLQGANQTHGIKDADMVKGFEEYLDEGHTTMDLFTTLTDLFSESGFFGKAKRPTKKTVKAEEISLDAEPTDDDEKTEL